MPRNLGTNIINLSDLRNLCIKPIHKSTCNIDKTDKEVM